MWNRKLYVCMYNVHIYSYFLDRGISHLALVCIRKAVSRKIDGRQLASFPPPPNISGPPSSLYPPVPSF